MADAIDFALMTTIDCKNEVPVCINIIKINMSVHACSQQILLLMVHYLIDLLFIFVLYNERGPHFRLCYAFITSSLLLVRSQIPLFDRVITWRSIHNKWIFWIYLNTIDCIIMSSEWASIAECLCLLNINTNIFTKL